jgi:hypothetical protein
MIGAIGAVADAFGSDWRKVASDREHEVSRTSSRHVLNAQQAGASQPSRA